MKKFFAISTLALMGFAGTAMAQGGFTGAAPAQGGFTGPTIDTVSVAEAKKLGDDTPVVMTGKIVKSLGGEKYMFQDGTDSITIEIDNEDWRGLTVSEKDTVEIRGEIDKDFMNVEVDVDSISKK